MASPAVLVSLETAKDHLRVRHDDEDAQIQSYLDVAEDMCQEYLGDQFDDTWDEDTLPGSVKAQILVTLAELWAHRGDEIPDGDAEQNAGGAVRFRYLYARKGPTVA